MKHVRWAVIAAVSLSGSVWAQSYGGSASRTDTASIVTPAHHWFMNRVVDFCDIFSFGIGFAHANPQTGPLTPTLGLHLQVTDYAHLGWLRYGGCSAEMEGRGFGTCMETRKIMGIGPFFKWDVDQEGLLMSYYKDGEASSRWAQRMDFEEANDGCSAHTVVHSGDGRFGYGEEAVHPRGWHNFAYTGVEVALPLGIPYTPVDTHLGFTLRVGFDTSQLTDFVLGFVGLDFWHDDLRRADNVPVRRMQYRR